MRTFLRPAIAPMRDDSTSVFVFPLQDVDKAALHADLAFLAPDERARLQRFVFDKDKVQYAATRSLLRRVLADYLHSSPHDIVFSFGRHGKPYLASKQGIDFNVSHCDGCAVVAVSTGAIVGVDIESLVVAQPYYGLVAQRYFSSAEYAWIDEDGLSGFTRYIELWTLKEAYIKAMGSGLTKALEDCEFAFTQANRIQFFDHASADPADDWRFELHDVLNTYRLSIAMKGGATKPTSIHFVDADGNVSQDQAQRCVKLLRHGRSACLKQKH